MSESVIKRLGGATRLWLVIVVGGAILARLPLLSLTLSSYGSDGWRQADTASIARHFYLNGYSILYPQVYWGGAGPGYVETEFQLYPFGVALLFATFGEQVWLGRVVSLVMSMSAFWLCYQLARQVLPQGRSADWAIAFLVLSPLYIRYSVAFMPEATVMLFYIAALFLFHWWTQNPQPSFLLAASICTALAILVKPTSIHIGLVFVLLALDRFGLRVIRRPEVWMAFLVSLLPALLWYWHARDLYWGYGNTFGLLSGGDSKFGNWTIWLSPSFYAALIQLDLQWVFAGGAGLPFLAGLVHCFRQREMRLPVYGIITVWIYYMIVARYAREEWGIHYHLYLLPYVALCVGWGMDWLFRQPQRGLSQLVAIVATGLFLFGTVKFYQKMMTPVQDVLVQCAVHVRALTPANSRIAVSTTSLAIDNGVPNNYQEPQIFYYSMRYGWSLPADRHTPEALEGLRKAGAEYFVIYSEDLLLNRPSLVDYLNRSTEQIGPGIAEGCGVYRFTK